MLKTLKLLLPALFPSWRFFDWIAPAPRIEVKINDQWKEFRPRPEYVSLPTMIKRMIWSPYWNDSLFLVSCAERLAENPTEHSYNQILKRIVSDTDCVDDTYIQFRLVFISRVKDQLQKDIQYISKIHRCDECEIV